MLAALSCSKTQDTAPERRVFGDPPTIKTVDDEHSNPPFFEPEHFISCDWTVNVVNEICYTGHVTGLQAQPGGGWTIDLKTGQGSINTTDPSPLPGVFIQGTYGEAVFRVSVTDPNSTSDRSDVLLVSASYVQPNSNVETSLVLFDDGSFSKFRNPQKRGPPGENCVVNPNGSCSCFLATYDVTSGDVQAKDGLWTRKIAVHDPEANAFLLDCIMHDEHETLIAVDKGTTVQFKIEAVDREGNLATWPSKLVAMTSTSLTKFSCNGDSCGCCILQSADPVSECGRLPGMLSPNFPDGLCIDAF